MKKRKPTKPQPVPLPTAPGLYDNIPFRDYLTRVKGMNSSTLRMFLTDTPSRVRERMTHPENEKETVSLLKGHASHAAVLEPARFEEEYARVPVCDRRTTEGKEAYAQFGAEHPTHIRLMPDEYDSCLAMRDAVLANPLAAQLLTGARAEVTALFSMPIWRDKATGEYSAGPQPPAAKGWARAGEIPCKARLDVLNLYEKWSVIVDLKTDKDASTAAFGRACEKYNYHAQAAMYLDALDMLAPRKRRFIHVVVDKRRPHDVAVRELDEPEIREGRAAYRFALATYAKCKKTGEWPGYFNGIEPQEMNRHRFKFTDPTQL